MRRISRRRLVGVVGLVVALAAITVFADIWFMSTLWFTTRSLYYVADSGDITSALLIALLTVWTVVGLVLAPSPRSRRGRARWGLARRCWAGLRMAWAPKTTAPQPQGRGAVIPTRSIA